MQGKPFVSWSWWQERLRRAWSRLELRCLGAIVVLATALRIVWVLFVNREPQGLHDPLFYYIYAAQIAEGNGYRLLDGSPTAYYPIGYPAALGGVFALVKHTPIPDNLVLAAGFFNIFLGVATVALAYEVGRRLFSPSVGLLAALWLAVFPNLIYHTAAYLSETLFNFLVLAALLVLLADDWRERRLGWGRLLFFGALLGASALVRPISLLFLPIVVIVWLATGFGWRRTLAYGGAVLAMTAAVIAPWTIRNAVVMDAPIIISANLGDDLCMGHYPGAPGSFALPDVCFAEERYAGLARPELETRRNEDNIRKAISFAVRNPRFELKLLSRKAYHTWEHDHDGLWAVESYNDDPFIRSPLSLRVIPAQVPDEQVAVVAAELSRLAGVDAGHVVRAIEEGKATTPMTPAVLKEQVAVEEVFEIRQAGLPGVRLVAEETALWTALARIADIFFFITISLGGLGLVAFVAPRPEPRRLFFLLALLALAGVPLAFFGDARFHVPALPLLSVAAAWVVVNVRQLPRLLAPAAALPSSTTTSGSVEVADGEASVAQQDTLQEA